MIYQATQAIANALKARNLEYSVKETEKFSYVETGFSGDHVKGVVMRFMSSSQNNDVALRVFRYIVVPNDKKAAVLLALNKLNDAYRYMKFVLDDNGTVTVSYDFPMDGIGDVGEVGFEMFARLFSILDEAYPILMNAVWA